MLLNWLGPNWNNVFLSQGKLQFLQLVHASEKWVSKILFAFYVKKGWHQLVPVSIPHKRRSLRHLHFSLRRHSFLVPKFFEKRQLRRLLYSLAFYQESIMYRPLLGLSAFCEVLLCKPRHVTIWSCIECYEYLI